MDDLEPVTTEQGETTMTMATLIEDRDVPGTYRVECEDEDGGMEVALFSGPNALNRAIIFAGGGDYYGGWNDPHGLAGH